MAIKWFPLPPHLQNKVVCPFHSTTTILLGVLKVILLKAKMIAQHYNIVNKFLNPELQYLGIVFFWFFFF